LLTILKSKLSKEVINWIGSRKMDCFRF